jgi:hypothetical protein
MQLEPTVGLEPTACALRVRRSTAELRRLPSFYYTPCNGLRNKGRHMFTGLQLVSGFKVARTGLNLVSEFCPIFEHPLLPTGSVRE